MYFYSYVYLFIFKYLLYLSLHQKHQRKLLVCENLLGNKSDSDSDVSAWSQVMKKVGIPGILYV